MQCIHIIHTNSNANTNTKEYIGENCVTFLIAGFLPIELIHVFQGMWKGCDCQCLPYTCLGTGTTSASIGATIVL